jgi:hypothetical protein
MELRQAREAMEAPDDASYAIPPGDFADLLIEIGEGFKLVHIERSEDRHFVGYYDFQPLLERPLIRERLVSAVVALVGAITGQVDRPNLVLYPADDENRAAVLAREVSARLPRATLKALGRREELRPTSTLWAAGTCATYVDWGVVTARTARLALDEMADAGAGRATFIAIASQLDRESERHLRGLMSIRGRAEAGPPDELPLDSPSAAQVPVAFVPVTRIAATSFTRLGCPLCITVSDFAQYAAEAPSDFLQNHARLKIEVLRARHREDALSTHTDLYGAEMSLVERANLIHVWSVIDRARRSVAGRADLLDLIGDQEASDFELTAASLCRIVAARHDLLHSPPLSESTFRRAVVDAIMSLISPDRGDAFISVPLKQQAIIALRASSKDRLARDLADLVVTNIRSRMVIGEILLAVYSILRRPYYQGRSLMDSLVEGLANADTAATAAYREGHVDRDIAQSIRSLRRSATAITQRRAHRDELSAWAALRGAYREDISYHHHAVNRIAQIGRQLNDLATTIAVYSRDPERILPELERIYAAWDVCLDFLSADVLPFLAPLKNILTARYYREQVREVSVWAGWDALLSSKAITETDLPFGQTLLRLLREPSEFTDPFRSELRSEIEWMQRIFLGMSVPEEPAVEPRRRREALLHRWLSECPSELAKLAPRVREEMLLIGGQEPEGLAAIADHHALRRVRVFLPLPLLQEIAHVVANNIDEHGDVTRTTCRVTVEEAGKEMLIGFISVGTAISAHNVSSPHGGGLTGLAERIAPFGGAVEAFVSGEDFVTTVSLRRWNED